MSIVDLARNAIRDLEPYSSARMEAGAGGVLLNANESAEGVLNRYPAQQPGPLREAMAAYYGIGVDSLLATRGSDEAIDIIVRTFCEPGDSIAIAPPTFGMYRTVAAIQGARTIEVPLDEEWQISPDEIAGTAAKVVFLCSPNNPTGNLIGEDAVARTLDKTRDRAVVVIDEAYVEFSGSESWAKRLDDHENLIVLRTLSKAHALAGARIGAMIARPELIELARKVLPPYPLPSPSVELAVKALSPALLDRTKSRVEKTLRIRGEVEARLERLPSVETVWPSDANFILARFREIDKVLEATRASGIAIRRIAAIPDSARITIGALEEMEALLDVLEKVRDD